MAIDLRDEEVDTVPTSGSTNPIDSNAVFVGLASKENTLPSMVGNSLKVLRVNAGETGKEWATVSGGNPLEGTNYLSVLAQGTPAENGQAVRNAYTFAQSMTPNGNALSSANRVTILLAPGLYTFNEAVVGAFTIDKSFIDFESLSGLTDVYFSSMKIVSTGTGKRINISGIDTTTNNYYSHGAFALYTIGGANENIYIKDCVGGNYSFGAFSSGFRGTIDNCVAGDYSFGYTSDFAPVGMSFVDVNPTLYGTYKNCIGGNYCFLSSSAVGTGIGIINNYGTIDNCRAGYNSFLYSLADSVSNSGTISNCVSTSNGSFCVSEGSSYASNSGLIINCTGSESSFVVGIDPLGAVYNQGRIIDCTAGSNCFTAHLTSFNLVYNYGSIINCNAQNGINAFCGAYGENTGLIYNCIAFSKAFCCDDATRIYTDIYRCTMIDDTFTVGVTSGGRVVLGIDTTGVVNY